MTRAEFMRSLRSVSLLLNETGILQQVYLTAPLRPSEQFTAEALVSNPNYQDLYRIGLRNRDYNILLTDYSFLQFSHSGQGHDLSLRFAFYGNPFSAIPYAEFEAAYDGMDYETYLQLLEEQEPSSATTIVRYDFALPDYVELRHPAAHLHLGLHEYSRWPVDKILTPVAFTLLISKLFYPNSWSEDLDHRLARSKRECMALTADFFTAKEREHPYFT